MELERAGMSTTANAVPRAGWTRTFWAALLSLFMPGLGQIYAGSLRLGVILLAIGVLLLTGVRLLTRAVPPLPAYVGLAGILLACLTVLGLG